ncbi:MAG TPA: SDR family oxidoreductase [Acidimicrobiia bacterium]|nr:SDR family oxidoreductase [Acidimicrobiia bacterium]
MTKVALVTGGSRGLGAALVKALAGRGWHVVTDARSAADLQTNFGDVQGVETIAGDVTDPAHREALLEAVQRVGRLDLLVNNASYLGPSPLPRLEAYPLEALRRVYEVNVIAPAALVQAFLPALRESRGSVLNVTSDAGVEGYSGWGGYGSSKAALEQASRVLAAEEPTLRVFWVDPGDMNTTMHQEAYPGEDISDRPPPEESVPGLLRLIEGQFASGRYEVREIMSRES